MEHESRKENTMVAFYEKKKKNQGWKLEDVPALWRKKVEAALAE